MGLLQVFLAINLLILASSYQTFMRAAFHKRGVRSALLSGVSAPTARLVKSTEVMSLLTTRRHVYNQRYLSTSMALADWCYGDFDKNNGDDRKQECNDVGGGGLTHSSVASSSFNSNFNSMQMNMNSAGGESEDLNSLMNKISESESRGVESSINTAKDVPEAKVEKKEEDTKINLDRGRNILYAELREWRRLYGEENQVAPYR